MKCITVLSKMTFFFFKQKTAYEMRISDWSSDVCSSDLLLPLIFHARDRLRRDGGPAFQILGRDARQGRAAHLIALRLPRLARDPQHRRQIGRASCRERVCQYV